jgi:hypothetical protein
MDPNNITTIGFRPDTVAAFSESKTVDLCQLEQPNHFADTAVTITPDTRPAP